MATDTFRETSLWKTSLGQPSDGAFAAERQALETSYLNVRRNAEMLLARIGQLLPDLTQHTVTHADALWRTASVLAGPEYPCNPLEGFVLGCAFLLHDAALCYEAYDGGQQKVRSTAEWKDAYAAECEAPQPIPEWNPEAAADFQALRRLHAAQASEIMGRSWTHPDTGDPLYLLPDPDLRGDLGHLIGQISASHHWSIEEVTAKFCRQFSAPVWLPREWRVDPIKLACLLRCADAAHIDSTRAPDFLYALLRRSRSSIQYWKAQNRLAPIDIDFEDREKQTLVISSKRPYDAAAVEAWWVAYDAACLVHRELQTCNALLESRPHRSMAPPFACRRVRGVESPELFAQLVQTEGWNPCQANLHVDNVEKLVASLGGETLYRGRPDMLEIAVRELVQNARDAICARQNLDPRFRGRVIVTLSVAGSAAEIWVEDDGVGMSKRVLTGPLLEFGGSFWASSLAQQEFPGLRSSRFRSIGHYGIGFYSTFMVAHAVSVASRRWDESVNNALELRFDNGLELRPVVRRSPISGTVPDISTRIVLKLKPGIMATQSRVPVKRNLVGARGFEVEFADYLAAIVAGLDVPVDYVGQNGRRQEIHKGLPEHLPRCDEWLARLSFAKYQDDSSEIEAYIANNHHRLRAIHHEGVSFGFAAISTRLRTGQDFLNVHAIRGLATTVHQRSSANFIGYINFSDESVRRDSGKPAAPDAALKEWAAQQLTILLGSRLSRPEMLAAAVSLSHFSVDPTSIAVIPVVAPGGMRLLTLEELEPLLARSPLYVEKGEHFDNAAPWLEADPHAGYTVVKPLGLGEYYSLALHEAMPKADFSLIGCVHRFLLSRGGKPVWELKRDVGRHHVYGRVDALICRI